VLYLAVEGGFAIDPVLGSVSTYARGQLGGLNGKPLSAGDTLPLALDHAGDRGEFRLEGFSLSRPARFRAVLGPQDAFFTDAAKQQLFEGDYTVKVESDRMALQLAGPKLDHAGSFDIISDGIAMGSIQVPGHGQPIVLMADRQTTGGYPKIATIVRADLARFVQLRPGSKVRFAAVTLQEAVALARSDAKRTESLIAAIRPAGLDRLDSARLLGLNLAGEAVDAAAGGPSKTS
jgi:biotin-dependent carboxylase-like uncharacterized protein